MASIKLRDVSVDLPIFSGVDRSLKRRILRAGTGGQIATNRDNHVVVRALTGITLDLRDGDRLALIGRNGAGKTTLLRVMAGICEPTQGRIALTGRVATLFDIASIMDPEMTGYENIRYAGAMLGLSRQQLRQLHAEVEDFTELGDYLHLPVRTYSSGMMVRLSFTIATSMDPEILLLDEAIGAGDAHFIAKAKQRAEQLYQRANILVMASHSAELLRDLCTHALWLAAGKVMAHGPVSEVLDAYERDGAAPGGTGARSDTAS